MKNNKVLPFLCFLYKSHDTHPRSAGVWKLSNLRCITQLFTNFPRCELNLLTCSLFHFHQHKRSNLTWRIEFSMSFNPGITIRGTDNFKGNIFTERHKNCIWENMPVQPTTGYPTLECPSCIPRDPWPTNNHLLFI